MEATLELETIIQKPLIDFKQFVPLTQVRLEPLGLYDLSEAELNKLRKNYNHEKFPKMINDTFLRVFKVIFG